MIELTGYRDKHEYTNKHGVKSVVYLMDCMTAMAQMGDKEFSLACVDPPYGINHSTTAGKQGGTQYGKAAAPKKTYQLKNWDNSTPPPAYFENLIRMSENQIVWGANYMTPNLPPSMGWIFWDKDNGGNGFSDGELAFTSFERGLRKVKITWNGMIQHDMKNKEERMHPTQKPIALYDWIFHNYAKPNDTIFDSHLGSGSSRIAADKHNLPFTGVELDPDYFRDHCKRFDRYTAQLTLF